MMLRQLFDPTSSTYSYLLSDEQTHEAVWIDPVREQHARDAALIRELGLRLLYTLDTHCHADHVTGAWLMKQAFRSRIGLSAAYRAKNVDLPLAHGDVVKFGAQVLEVRATPGHTDGCVSFVTADHRIAFTGDSLLVRAAGRTDFQNGDPRQLFRSIHEQLFSLPDECIVYPGHDYEGRAASTIGEERRLNPRIGGDAREDDFVGYMNNLGLPPPKQMATAVPANLRAGEPEGSAPEQDPEWGPVVKSLGGAWEIAPEWVAVHRAEVHVLDVRTPPEFVGQLGHLDGAQLIPLDELRDRMGEVKSDLPLVVVCHSGRRSALATTILSKAGFGRVANLVGGMVLWRNLGLPS